VLAGVSIEICGSTLLSFILGMVYMAQVGTPGMTPSQVDDALRSMPQQSPLVSLGILLGALVSVAAGYVTARVARRNEYVVGAIMAAATTLICQALEDTSRQPIDLTLLFILSDVACNMLGAKYGAARNRRLALQSAAAVDTAP
jgi:MFS family permease